MIKVSRRQRRLEAKKLIHKIPVKFEQIDLSKKDHPGWMSRAYINNKYTVMIDDHHSTTHGKAIRIMVQQHDDLPIKNHWMEMFKIKNELFGEETLAIEYYPKQSQFVNQHNIYWMWVYPDGIIPIPEM